MTTKERAFVATVKRFYQAHGRHDLPWRQHLNPYKILVSELMLQQTQVERVLPKYEAFMQQWPTVADLSAASLGDVLRAWQGLGYNRRARYLHHCAQQITSDYAGVFPHTTSELQALPGIGPYTAGALLAFAYNQPVVIIETNIRTVFLHHFFAQASDVADRTIKALVAKTLDAQSPRDWYWALMDYGSNLKRTHGSLNQKSRHYTKQSTFKGSQRQLRGLIIRLLSQRAHSKPQLITAATNFSHSVLETQLQNLLTEGLIKKSGTLYRLPD